MVIYVNLEQRKSWNENHKLLTSIILKPAEHQISTELFLTQHALLYCSLVGNLEYPSLEDELLKDIKEETLRKYPVKSPDTRNSIIWHIWHIARIEDITMNILVNESGQVLHDGNWLHKMKVKASHSGNGMEEQEVAELSSCIDIEALLSYRIAVGRRTREIIRSLQPGQFKQKVESVQLNKIMEQGAVKESEKWLIEYWGNKNIAGLVLMPATRHNFVHLNKSIRIKNKIQK